MCWTKGRARCAKASLPETVEFATKPKRAGEAMAFLSKLSSERNESKGANRRLVRMAALVPSVPESAISPPGFSSSHRHKILSSPGRYGDDDIRPRPPSVYDEACAEPGCKGSRNSSSIWRRVPSSERQDAAQPPTRAKLQRLMHAPARLQSGRHQGHLPRENRYRRTRRMLSPGRLHVPIKACIRRNDKIRRPPASSFVLKSVGYFLDRI